MFSKFIHRPVLAIVISIMIVLVGIIAIFKLPITQFPEIAPPRVMVFIAYPGASADVLVNSTLIPLEQSINGVPGMRYIVSDATSAGEATIQIIFDPDTDPNAAVVQVKNRVDKAINQLPALVRLEGVIVQTVQPSMLMFINIFSNKEETDEKFLFNYASINLLPELIRIKGVGQVNNLGSRTYAMRIWLDPNRMRAYNISVDDVMEAIAEQSIIGRPGRIGRSSGIKAQSLEYVLYYKGRYNTPEEYEKIIIRANAEGEILYLKDIAKIELNSEFYDIYSSLDGKPAAALVVKQTFNSNAKEVIKQVKDKLLELKEDFPPGVDYNITYDVSNFLDESINKVLHTILEAFVLVALVVYLFLGDWRSTFIPIIAVPVSLIGSFIVINALGMTINLITLFAMVLAIGIVVDNAIVVVEAVHHKMDTQDISLYNAVQKVLGEISGAVIAITLMMTAVFVPVYFMPGPVGVLLKQFSVTMASAIVISGFVALTLTPVMCAMILKKKSKSEIVEKNKKNLLSKILEKFNKNFDKLTEFYVKSIQKIICHKKLTTGLLVIFCLGIFIFNKVVPVGFIPNEDQSMLYAIIQTPPGSTLEATYEAARKLQVIAKEVEGVKSVSSLAGFEILTEGRGSNSGTCIINLEEWSERDKSINEIIEELELKVKDLGTTVEFFEPPAVPGFGAAGGISFRLIDKSNNASYKQFDDINKTFINKLQNRKELTGLFTFYNANFPQYEVEIDPKVAIQKGVSINDAIENLNILIGSTYEQGFIKFGRFFKVYVQSSPEFRDLPDDVLNLYTKNDKNEMVPNSSFMKMNKTQGPNEITRYNVYNSSAIRAVPTSGYTTGEAIKAVLEVAQKELPRGYTVAWEGLSYDEAGRGNEAIYIFIIVLVFVYLILSAQYESFIIPFAVLLSLPPGIFGAYFMLKIMGLANDVYAQVSLIMLVGMLGKNAVLIVEFARQKEAAGMNVKEAAIEAARLRFRPILMTSLAFIAGLIPLTLATGAGAIANNTLGSSAFGGMIFGTMFGVLIIPGLYYIFASFSSGHDLIKNEAKNPITEK